MRSSTDIDLILGRHKRKGPRTENSEESEDTKGQRLPTAKIERDQEEAGK